MNTTISNSTLSATINPKGAELISFKNHTLNREYIWEGNPDYWGKHSPILFPIVGTLKNNYYDYNGKKFELTRHGFARDLNFKIVNKENDRITFSLQFNETTLTFYPFKFELQIIYSLNNSELLVEYKVLNIDNVTIPFSIGGHPAFALNDRFETYSLQFKANENLKSYELENDLLSERTKTIPLKNGILPLSYSLFEKDALIFKTLNSKQIQILENNIPFLNFKFKDFPNFGIWTKKNAPFICLEPWFGYSDPFNSNVSIMEKEGIQLLEKTKHLNVVLVLKFYNLTKNMLEINFHSFQNLETERLFLRRIDENDVAEVLAMRGNPDVMKYIPRPIAKTKEDALEHIAMIENKIVNNIGINWGITVKGNTKIIGIIGHYRIQPENHRAEIGYMSLPEYNGKGYITEAIKVVVEYGFEQMNLHSIEAVIDPDNVASERVLQKNGFVKEAHILENELWEGKFWDTVIYSLLKRNFKK